MNSNNITPQNEIESLAKGFEVFELADKAIISPVPIRLNASFLAHDTIFENYYDTPNNTLDIENFLYDCQASIELQLGFLLNQDTCSDTSSERSIISAANV
jgi:hypothetical protein